MSGIQMQRIERVKLAMAVAGAESECVDWANKAKSFWQGAAVAGEWAGSVQLRLRPTVLGLCSV